MDLFDLIFCTLYRNTSMYPTTRSTCTAIAIVNINSKSREVEDEGDPSKYHSPHAIRNGLFETLTKLVESASETRTKGASLRTASHHQHTAVFP